MTDALVAITGFSTEIARKNYSLLIGNGLQDRTRTRYILQTLKYIYWFFMVDGEPFALGRKRTFVWAPPRKSRRSKPKPARISPETAVRRGCNDSSKDAIGSKSAVCPLLRESIESNILEVRSFSFWGDEPITV